MVLLPFETMFHGGLVLSLAYYSYVIDKFGCCYIEQAAQQISVESIHMINMLKDEMFRQHPEVFVVNLIEKAFRDKKFYLRGQPIINVSQTIETHKKTEILLGVDDAVPELELSVIDVVSLLEKHEKTMLMDEFVISSIFDYMETNHPLFESDVQVFVNLSGVTLNNSMFLQKLARLLASHPSMARKICFELTERVRIKDYESVREFMQVAKLHGTQFSFDDFGVGYASFDYLMNLPVNYIKIDGSFVTLAGERAEAVAIITGIVSMAKSLNIKTVAEHIETKTQYDVVKSLGVDYVQGFFCSMPERIYPNPSVVPKTSSLYENLILT